MTYLENIATRTLEEIPVSELDIGLRGRKRLDQLNANNLADLLNFDVEDILGGSFGKATLNRLMNELTRYDVQVKTRKQRRHEEICEAIYSAMRDGADSQVLIAELTRENIHNLRYHAEKANIALPVGKRGVKPRRFISRELDVEKGLRLRDYSKRWDISHQGASDYIDRSGLYKRWQVARIKRLAEEKNKRLGQKQEEKERKREDSEKRLVEAYERAKEIDDWAYLRSVEYCLLFKRETGMDTGIAFKKLLRLFENYEPVYENNEEPNYFRLCKKSGIKNWLRVKKVIERIKPWLETD